MANRATQQFTRGQTIVQEGTPGDSTFRIISGEVIICKKSETGEQVPIAKLGAGEMFGEMYLFDHSLSRTASAIALTSDVHLEVLPPDEIRTMISSLHPSVNRIFEGLSMRLQKISGKYVNTMTAQKAHSQAVKSQQTANNSYIHNPPLE